MNRQIKYRTNFTFIYVRLISIFLEGLRSGSYGSTAALRLLVQPCDENER
jgi:hypothetical protein